jgi:conjugal transfer pilus assembly protein TraA
MFAVGALAVGLGIGIVKQSVMSVAVGTGIALAASGGPAVLSGIFGATF